MPVVGFELLAVTFAYVLDIVAYGEEGVALLIRVENRFRFDHPDGTSREFDVSSDPWEALAPVLALRHDGLHSALARPDGTMAVQFASGHRISAWPHPDYESWRLTGPGFKLICGPGGEVQFFNNGSSG